MKRGKMKENSSILWTCPMPTRRLLGEYLAMSIHKLRYSEPKFVTNEPSACVRETLIQTLYYRETERIQSFQISKGLPNQIG